MDFKNVLASIDVLPAIKQKHLKEFPGAKGFRELDRPMLINFSDQ